MFNFTLTTPISFLISLAALTGVTLHDTKVDKLATSFAGIPAITSTTEASAKSISSEPHTHVERVNVSELRSSLPRLVPKTEHKKHLMQKNVPKGWHSFDGYALPVV